MISYTISEVILSLISAIIYGAAFAIFTQLARSVVPLLRYAAAFPLSVLFYDGSIRSMPVLSRKERKRLFPNILPRISEGVYAFFAIFAFFFGFILLSYAFLDGEIRLYMMATCALSFYFFKRIVILYAYKTVSRLLFTGYCTALIVFRIVFLPLRRIIILIKRVLSHFEEFFYKKMPKKP